MLGLQVTNVCQRAGRTCSKFKVKDVGTHVVKVKNMKLVSIETAFFTASSFVGAGVIQFRCPGGAASSANPRTLIFEEEAVLWQQEFDVVSRGRETLTGKLQCKWVGFNGQAIALKCEVVSR